MWKVLKEPWLMTLTLVDVAASWGVSWLLVFKAGWRWNDLDGRALDATFSFMAYLVAFGTLVPIALLMLAVPVSVWLENAKAKRSLRAG